MNNKHVIAIVLMIIIAVTACGNAYCEDKFTNHEPIFLSIVDRNAKEWMEDETSRALFAACSLLDYGLADDIPYDLNGLYGGSVFVARDSLVLFTGYIGPDKDESLVLMFDTTHKKSAYRVLAISSRADLRSVLEEVCEDGCYKVDIVDLKDAVDAIQEVLREE